MKGVVDVVTHQYIIFINKLYSGIFILPRGLTPSMFAYINWQNKDGKEMKTLLQASKAEHMADEMRKLGVEPKIIMQSTSQPSPLTYIK